MPKRFDTPEDFKKFRGYVEFRDPLPLAAVAMLEEAIAQAKDATGARMNALMLPAINACVSEWHVEGIPDSPTTDTFPGSPRIESARVMGWLINSVMEIYHGEGLDETDPNE